MTFYFYDLETSGINPRTDRIMQFAGQRTDSRLKPIDEPDNILIKMTPDTLPQPDAVLVTGITPQQTQLDGITEAEFLDYFTNHVCRPDTIFVGYNSIRFDDEFMRYMMWRNFYDAYEWHWKSGCSRWDLLDIVRMTRALRPKGIKWPFTPDGKPSNRLELISSINGLDHVNAHDALSDVNAAIAVAQMIRQKQPKLFDYLLNLRSKTAVEALVSKGDPLVYSSGRYGAEFEKTTVAVMVGRTASRPGALMYDLRTDPGELLDLSAGQLAALMGKKEKDEPPFPVKLLSYNRCPAIAPLSVLDVDSQKRLKLDMDSIQQNLRKLASHPKFGEKLSEAFETVWSSKQASLIADSQTVDGQLYEAFISGEDKIRMSAVRAAPAEELTPSNFKFSDQRLNFLLPLYKARNYPKSLTETEAIWWEDFRRQKLFAGGADSAAGKYFKRLAEIAEEARLNNETKYLLEELNLYGQSISI